MKKKTLEWLALMISGVVLLASPASAAVRYTVETVTTYKEQKYQRVEDVVVDGKRARVDYRSGTPDSLQPDGYMLTTDGGDSWAVVEGPDAVCGTWDLAAYFRQAGTLIDKVEKWVNAKVDEASVETLLVEPGPQMLGYATTHVRMVSKLRAKARVLFIKYEYHLEITDDVWFAPELGVNPVEKRWFDAMKRTGYERLDQMTEATLAPIKGTVLKQTTVTKSRDVRKNRERIKVDEINMTSFARVDSAEISDGLFSVDGCRQVNDKKMEDAVKDMLKSVVKP